MKEPFRFFAGYDWVSFGPVPPITALVEYADDDDDVAVVAEGAD